MIFDIKGVIKEVINNAMIELKAPEKNNGEQIGEHIQSVLRGGRGELDKEFPPHIKFK